MKIVHDNFLNNLEKEGTTNMKEAGPILEEAFWVSKHQAQSILREWEASKKLLNDNQNNQKDGKKQKEKPIRSGTRKN